MPTGDKEDAKLKSLATDSVKAGWREALPQFAVEMRERFQQGRGRPFSMFPTEVLLEGDRAVVKCDDPKGTPVRLSELLEELEHLAVEFVAAEIFVSHVGASAVEHAEAAAQIP